VRKYFIWITIVLFGMKDTEERRVKMAVADMSHPGFDAATSARI